MTIELKNSRNPEKPLAWADFLRSTSIFLVIVIHTAAPLAYQWEDISRTDWMVGNFFNSFSRVSVPVLFMISGFLLLGKQQSISAFYRKRFRKVLIPLFFWSVVYLIWENGYRDFTFVNAVKAIVYAIITAPASYHMWYLYELLPIYLFVPLIRVFVRSAERIHLWYFAGIWFLFGPVKDILENLLDIHFAIDLGFFTGYIGFFIIGHLLGAIDISARIARIAGAVYALAGIYTVYATYTLSSNAGDYVQYYYWYTRINIVLMSFAAFILLKWVGTNLLNEWATRFFRQFAGASFGIYLVHVLVLVTLKRNEVSAFSGPALFTVPAVSLLVLLIAWMIVAIIQRIPLLREIAP